MARLNAYWCRIKCISCGIIICCVSVITVQADMSQYYGPPEMFVYDYAQTVFTNENSAFAEGSYNRYTDRINWTNSLDGASGTMTGLSSTERYWSLWLPLSEGTNNYTLCAVNKTGQTVCVSIRFVKISSHPELTLQNAQLEFEGVIGAPNPTGLTFSVKNSGRKTLDYTVKPLDAWVLCVQTNGSLEADASKSYSVVPDIGSFSEGNYQGRIRVASNGGTQDVTVALAVRQPRYDWTGGAGDSAWSNIYNWCDRVVPDAPECLAAFTNYVSAAAFPCLQQSREIGRLAFGGQFNQSLYISGADLQLGSTNQTGYLLDIRQTASPRICGLSNRVILARGGEWRVNGLQQLIFLGDISLERADKVSVTGGGTVLLGGHSAVRRLAGGVDVSSGVLSIEGALDCGTDGRVAVDEESILQVSGPGGDTMTEAVISNATPASTMIDLRGMLLLNADADSNDLLRCETGITAFGTNSVIRLNDEGIVDTAIFTLLNALSVSGCFEYIEFPYSHVLVYESNRLQASPRYPWTDASGNHAWNSSFNWVIPGNRIPEPDTPLMINAVYNPVPYIQSNGQARSLSFYGNGKAVVGGAADAWLAVTNAPYGEAFVEVYSNAQVELNVALRIPDSGYCRLHSQSVLTLNKKVGQSQAEVMRVKGAGTCLVNGELVCASTRIDGGTLGGTGCLFGTTVIGTEAVLAPGPGIGTGTFHQLSIAGRCLMEMSNVSADRVNVVSNLVLDACSTLELSGNADDEKEYTLFSYQACSGVFGDYKGFTGTQRLRYESESIRCVTVTGAAENVLAGAWTRTVKIPVTADTNEVWFCTSNDPWITISSGAFGTGCHTVVVTVARNTGLNERTGRFVVAGKEYAVKQYGLIRGRNDFDGDGVSDIGCYYASGGAWYFYRSTLGFLATRFGAADTYPVTGDFDGDGLCDYGYYYPPDGEWQIMKSRDGQWATQFGFKNTVPVIGDFDGDGITDFGCYFAEDGVWFIYKSESGFWMNNFGFSGTVPITGDFDGDGRCDFGCYYPPQGLWYVYRSLDGFWVNAFGYEGTIPITGDFDADGKGDFGCYYPPEGYWYVYKSREGFHVNKFGYGGTLPITGDYDGDQQCDFGCYYPPQGYWYIYRSQTGFSVMQFGYTGTIPIGMY